ncbi:MAG: NapC/NirT family cytochrome c [Gammaproteobacteria bacterium]|nr:NapC/NirT family cytochrome c [Gammaproteobacteria bacterium]
MVVRSRDERSNDVRASLLAIPGVEVHPSLRRRAVDNHIRGFDKGLTCIDCHKGIAHELPGMVDEDASAVLLKH